MLHRTEGHHQGGSTRLEAVVKKFPKHARAKDAAKLIADLKKDNK